MIALDQGSVSGWLVSVGTGGAVWWILGTAVRFLPTPLASERWYGWLYSTLQAIAANHDLWGRPNLGIKNDGEPVTTKSI